MKFHCWRRWRVFIVGFDISQDRMAWVFLWPFVFVWDWGQAIPFGIAEPR
jgi:hypothetical protein